MWIKSIQRDVCDVTCVFDPLLFVLSVCDPSRHAQALAPALAPALAGAGLLAMLSLGAVGSVAHCAPMCGPIVCGQVMERLACVPCGRMGGLSRMRHGLLPWYHAGRIVTYALLGALAGAAGLGLQAAFQPLRGVVLLLAALGFLLAAWGRAGLPQAGAAVRFKAWAGPLLHRVRPGGFGYGLALGLLPCGLVYLALVGACAAGGPVMGAVSMVAFGVGTVPLLAMVGAGSHVIGRRLQGWAPVVLAGNAAVLLVAAVAGLLI